MSINILKEKPLTLKLCGTTRLVQHQEHFFATIVGTRNVHDASRDSSKRRILLLEEKGSLHSPSGHTSKESFEAYACIHQECFLFLKKKKVGKG